MAHVKVKLITEINGERVSKETLKGHITDRREIANFAADVKRLVDTVAGRY